jgi:hypothetical protein
VRPERPASNQRVVRILQHAVDHENLAVGKLANAGISKNIG